MQRVHSTLQQSLPEDVAREVCERTASKASIVGSIAELGGQYVTGLNAIDCATGDALARQQVQAASKQQVLSAMDAVFVLRRPRPRTGVGGTNSVFSMRLQTDGPNGAYTREIKFLCSTYRR